MHAVRGVWVGQTFALSKSNEYEGKKSRIRRTKEERKIMVESFIKKYQSSNNGNFPSLNLTHKEVGGSFYIVREIVREIIQENRVLGPAHFSPDERSANQFDEQHPLGSISREPQVPFNITSNGSHSIPNHDQGASREPVVISDGLCSEHEKQRFDDEGVINGIHVVMEVAESAKMTSEGGSHFISNHDQGASKEPVAVPDGLCSEHEKQRFVSEGVINGSQVVMEVENSAKMTSEAGPNHDQGASKEPVAVSDGLCSEHEEQRFDNEGVINGSQIVMKVEESAKRISEELQTRKPSEAEERVGKLAAARATVNPISAEVVVETFPLRSVPKTVESSSEGSGVENLTENLGENEIEKLDLDSDNGSVPTDHINSLEKKGESPAGLVLDKNYDLVDKELVEHCADSQVKISNISSIGGIAPNTLVNKEVEVEDSDNDALTTKMLERTSRIDDNMETSAPNAKILSGTVESRTPKGIVFENKSDVERKESLQKERNPKLDRIKIKSWDGASRISAAKESNPFLDACRSFINALIKFWSE